MKYLRKKTFTIALFFIAVSISLIAANKARGTWTSDVTPPTLTISPVLSANSASPTLLPAPSASITLTCTDEAGGSGCASISYDIHSYSGGYSGTEHTSSSAPVWPMTGNPATTSTTTIPITEFSGYPYVKINASATDNAGNTSSTYTYYFVFGQNITGTIYYDSDHDGVSGTADTAYSGIFTVTANGGSCAVSGNTYTCSDLAPGSYSIKIDLTNQTNPSYVVDSPCPVSALSQTCAQSLTIASSDISQDFYVTKLYSIQGYVFDDVNKNAQLDGSDSAYNGATITVPVYPSGSPSIANTTSANGNYSFLNLISGTYYVQITVPSSWIKTYPPKGTDYYVAVVGDSGGASGACSLIPDSPDSTYAPPNMCSSGNLLGVDFGLSDSVVWQQCVGADCNFAGGGSSGGGGSGGGGGGSGGGDNVPPNPSNTCSAGSYAIGTNGTSTTPGVYFGETPTPPSAISSTGWIANNYDFSPVTAGVIRTSYGYISTTLSQAGITPTDLSSICAISSCNLPSNPTSFPNGVYKANGDLYLNTTTFPYDSVNNKGKNYVILVNGNLYIDGKILVPVGSTATFYVSGNIVVDKGVGESTPTVCVPSTHAGCDVEGFYSTDNKFIIQNNQQIDYSNDCSEPPPNNIDPQLNIAGSVVVNASDNPNNPSTIINNRDLCAQDQTCPTYSITERPDMILNAPELIDHPNYIWQEVAP